MKIIVLLTGLTLTLGGVGLADAQEFRPLAGRYALTSANMVDPTPGEKPDRVVVFIEGSAAEQMYMGMPQKPAKDRCAGDVLSKKAGNLVCSKLDSGKHFCTFGVGLKDGQIRNGRVC
jgi:hypothetical protein